MIVHRIKSWPDSFEPMWDGSKTFELRYNDRGYKYGDMLLLREWDNQTKEYSGREIDARITRVDRGGLKHFAQLDSTWVILSVRVIAHRVADTGDYEKRAR